MPSSSKPSPIPNTSAIANSKNGSQTISIPTLSTLIGCPKMLPNWRSAGRANPPSSAAVPSNPRCSTDGNGLIVSELVLNALKHAFPGDRTDHRITVAYDVAGTNWKLSIADNGIGKRTDAFAQAKAGLGT